MQAPVGRGGWAGLSSELDKNGPVLSDSGDVGMGLGVGRGWSSSESDRNGTNSSDSGEGCFIPIFGQEWAGFV